MHLINSAEHQSVGNLPDESSPSEPLQAPHGQYGAVGEPQVLPVDEQPTGAGLLRASSLHLPVQRGLCAARHAPVPYLRAHVRTVPEFRRFGIDVRRRSGGRH